MTAPSSPKTGRHPGVPLTVTSIVAGALLLAGVARLGYGVGAEHGATSRTVIGHAYVGDAQAGVRVGSWSYDIPTTGGALEWFDAGGAHEEGMAPCLRTPGTYAWVRIGYSPARGPDTSTWRQVTWVQCIPRP